MRVRLLASIASLTCHLFGSGECCAKGADDSVEVNFALSVGLLIDVQCLACLWKDRVAVEAGSLEFFAAHAMQLYSIVLGLVTSWFSSVRLENRFDAEELAEKERQMPIDEERIYVAKPKADPD